MSIRKLNIEDANEWPLKAQIVFVVVSFLVVQGGLFWYYIHPRLSELNEYEHVQQEHYEYLETERSIEKKLAENKRALLLAERQYQTLQPYFSGQKSLSGLIGAINQTARRNDLMFLNADWKKSDLKSEWKTTTLSIELQGEFHHLGGFLESLSKAKHVIDIQKMEVTKHSSKNSRLKITIQANTYQLPIRRVPVHQSIAVTSYEKEEQPRIFYLGNQRRDPFFHTHELDGNEEPTLRCETADIEAKEALLEGYSIEELAFKGTIRTQRNLGLVLAPDGRLISVIKGQYLGREKVEVISIKPSYLLVQVELPDGFGCWYSQLLKWPDGGEP